MIAFRHHLATACPSRTAPLRYVFLGRTILLYPRRLSSSLPLPKRYPSVRRSDIDPAAFLFAACVSIAVTYSVANRRLSGYSKGQEEVEQAEHGEKPIMTSPIPPGRPGNLTAEQEAKLKEMWTILLEIFGVTPHPTAANGTDSPASALTSPEKTKKKRNRLSFFSRKDKTETEPGSEASSLSDINDKHGQSKDFAHALSSQTPEELGNASWRMTKFDHPDALLLRFLRARKWDVHAALVMLISTIHWRSQEMHVERDILMTGEQNALRLSQSEDPDERKEGEDFMVQLRTGKSFLHGTDKEGRPCCYVRARLHRQGEQGEKSLEQFTVYTIETARMLLRPPVDTATIVFDMTDFTLANMDYTPVKFMIKCFEANYPESLGSVLVYKAPWVFSGIWKIVKGWLDPVVAGKVHFAGNVDELAEFIPREKIIKELGGPDEWEFKYVEPVEGENAVLLETEKYGEENQRLEAERKDLIKEFQDETIKWIQGTSDGAVRGELARKLSENYWALDPHVRARSLYDRTGIIKKGGGVDFDAA